MIKTAKSHFKYSTVREYLLILKKFARNSDHDPNSIPEPDQIDETAKAAIPYVNHGRWIADCPSKCGGAMLLDPDLPFMCGNCFNVEIGGKWRPVHWPPDNNVNAIEGILKKRPLAINRNWTPDETIEDLHRENEKHNHGGV